MAFVKDWKSAICGVFSSIERTLVVLIIFLVVPFLTASL